MAPRWFNMTVCRFRKLRKATLAAFLAFTPTPAVDSVLPLSLSTGCPVPEPIARPSLPSVDYDLTREDARITCTNHRRGTVAEFLVETCTHGALAGKRIASVLDGDQWIGFAFVDDFGLTVWRNKRGGSSPSTCDRYASFLCDLSGALAKGVSIEITLID